MLLSLSLSSLHHLIRDRDAKADANPYPILERRTKTLNEARREVLIHVDRIHQPLIRAVPRHNVKDAIRRIGRLEHITALRNVGDADEDGRAIRVPHAVIREVGPPRLWLRLGDGATLCAAERLRFA